MTADQHLSDERLSAHIDGEDEEAAAHVHECQVCATRLAQLRDAVDALAAPPPVGAPEARDSAVRAALDAADAPALPVPRGRSLPPRWLAAAVVVVALAIAAPLLTRIGSGSSDRTSTAARTASKSALSDNTLSSATPLPDLGDQSDPTKLGEAIRAMLGPRQGPLSSETADDAAQSGPASGAAAGSAAPSPAPAPACATTVRAIYGTGLGDLLLTASLRWKGAPAVLQAYRIGDPGSKLTVRLFVIAAADCQLLVSQSL